jgi:hypothetical protein
LQCQDFEGIRAADPTTPKASFATLATTSVISQQHGEVLDIDTAAKTFTAEFYDPEDEGRSIVTIPTTQLPDDERAALVVGSVVSWTMFEHGLGRKDRTARVRLRREPSWNVDELERNAGAFAFLSEVRE